MGRQKRNRTTAKRAAKDLAGSARITDGTDLTARKAPIGGTLGDGSVRFLKDTVTTTTWR